MADQFETHLRYAWDWFSYHADQRLKAFHFFLISIGVVLVAFTKAIEERWRVPGLGIGILGALVATAYWVLDVRNEELVECGRASLDELEKKLPKEIRTRERDKERSELKNVLSGPLESRLYRVVAKNGDRQGRAFRHRTWLRLIEAAVMLFFVFGACWSAAGYPWLARSTASAKCRTALLPPDTQRQLGQAQILLCD